MRVVCTLLDGELIAETLSAEAGLNEPAYSQQAAIVEAEGLIRRRRDAQSNRYSIALPAVPAQAKLLHKLSCPHAPRI